MNLEVAQHELGEQIRRHPERLMDVFNQMLKIHKEVKHLRATDPDAALARIDRITNQLHILKQVTASSLGIQKYAQWMAHLNRIYQNCEQERQDIMMDTARAANERHGGTEGDNHAGEVEWNRTLLSAWKYPTLQESFVLRLVRAIALPILHPALGEAGGNILVSGPSMTGKTHALRMLRQFVEPHTTLTWHEWGAYRFMNEAEWRVKAENDNAMGANGGGDVSSGGGDVSLGGWNVYVVDKVSMSDVVHWRQQPWFRSWCAAMRASPRRLWIVLLEDERPDADGDDGEALHARDDARRPERGGDHGGTDATRRARATASSSSPDAPSSHDDDDELTVADGGRTASYRKIRAYIRDLFPVHVRFQRPNAQTLYAFVRDLLTTRFGARSARPTYVRMPIDEQLGELSRVASSMAQAGATFEEVRRSVEKACERVGWLALQDNVAYEVTPGTWLARNSIALPRLHQYQYSLLYPMGGDRIDLTLPSDAVGTRTYWNCQLLDRMPCTELGRLANVYIDPDTIDEDVFEIVANVEVRLDQFPHHLEAGWGKCFEFVLAAWFAGWSAVARANVAQHEALQRVAGHEHLCSWMSQLSSLNAAHTVRDLAALPSRHLARWFAYERRVASLHCQATAAAPHTPSTPSSPLIEHMCGHRDAIHGVHTQFFILYVEQADAGILQKKRRKNEGEEGSTPPRFHLTWGGRNSADVLNGRYRHGIPGDVSADDLRLLLDHLQHATPPDDHRSSCEVVQVRTPRGYAYHLMFTEPPATDCPIAHGVEHTSVRLLPRLQLLDVGTDLPADYTITNESDIDVLQDRYPQDYRHLYRDDEETWKLQPLRHASHRRFLSSKYSREVKCYLTLYHSLLQLRRYQYAAMTVDHRARLDALLSEVRSYLDFALLIVSDKDEKGKWNGAWSMSANHRLNSQYHLSDGDADDPITIDVATDWIEKGVECHVSPRLLESLYELCAARCDAVPSKSKSTTAAASSQEPQPSAVMKQLFDAWHAHRAGLHDVTTRWVYVKSSVPRATWCAARAACHLLRPSAEIAEMVRDGEWHSHYQARCRTSLYHQVFARATHIGTRAADAIAWHAFQPWAGAEQQLARVMQHRSGLWNLMVRGVTETHMQHILFAMYATCRADTPSWPLFYAHLFSFPQLAQWDADATAVAAAATATRDLFASRCVPAAINRLLDLHRFIHQHVLRGASPAQGTVSTPTTVVPGMVGRSERVDRKRRVLTEAEIKGLCIYGVAAHHVEDAFQALAGHRL